MANKKEPILTDALNSTEEVNSEKQTSGNDLIDLDYTPSEDNAQELPGYLVVLPHSLMELHVHGLIVKQEDVIKSSLTSTKRLLNTVFHTLYDCIDTADKEKYKDRIGTYQKFISNISMVDRDALFFGLSAATYDTKNKTTLTCGSCSKKFEEVCDIEAIQKIQFCKEKDILNKKHKFTIPELKWIVTLKIPSCKDDLMNVEHDDRNKVAPNSASMWMFIDSIEFAVKNVKGDTLPHIAENINEIYAYLESVPAKFGRRIKEEYLKVFGETGDITAKFECICPHCNGEVSVEINALNHFFFLVGQ